MSKVADTGERKEEREYRERIEERDGKEREVMKGGPHCHVTSNSAKPSSKTAQWPNMNGFESWASMDV